jgi:hypothetical protein
MPRQRLEQELAQMKQEYRERAADLELNTSQNSAVSFFILFNINLHIMALTLFSFLQFSGFLSFLCGSGFGVFITVKTQKGFILKY